MCLSYQSLGKKANKNVLPNNDVQRFNVKVTDNK